MEERAGERRHRFCRNTPLLGPLPTSASWREEVEPAQENLRGARRFQRRVAFQLRRTNSTTPAGVVEFSNPLPGVSLADSLDPRLISGILSGCAAGLKATDVTAWAGASPASAGSGTSFPHFYRGLKGRNHSPDLFNASNVPP